MRLYSRAILPTSTIKIELFNNVGFLIARTIVDSPQFVTVGVVSEGNYELEIEGPDIQPVTQQFTVHPGEGIHTETVELRPAMTEQFPTEIRGSVLRDKNVPPKAQKELDKAAEASYHHEWAKAVKSYEKAVQIYPNGAAPYMYLATALLRLGEKDKAKDALQKAITLKPDYEPPYIMLARVYAGEQQYPPIVDLLQKAISMHGDDAEALFLLSNADLQTGKYADAVVNARKVHLLPHRGFEAAHFICGLALAQEHKNDEAAEELKIFLKEAPQSTMAPRARDALASLSSPDGGLHEISVKDLPAAVSARELGSIAAANPVPPLPRKFWAPPDVDDKMPAVQKDQPCDLHQIVAQVSSRVKELAVNLQEFTATERIEQAEIDNDGKERKPITAQFDYGAEIRENGPSHLTVQEYRNGTVAFDVFPSKLATTGMAAFALIFHPDYVNDFTITCEGQSNVEGEPAWQLHFSEYPDAKVNFRGYQVSGKYYPIKLKGRAWISASTYQVMKLETDLLEPLPNILQWEHVTITYHSVAFAKRKVDLWLPETEEIYMNYRGHNYRDQHKLSNFQLFAVDSDEKVNIKQN